MKKEHIKLSEKDRKQLKELLGKGSLKSRTYKRIVSLLELDKGKTYEAVKETVQFSLVTLGKLAKRYEERGLDCIYDAPRPGRPISISKKQENAIILLSCSDAPEGYSQWSLRLLADKIVELGYCDEISHTQVRDIL
ncbi:MAG: helix-turn-helix domain-containing protein, partial [Saprospiraceae bacterium]|nr:helix-turn-helix domain-containing protein [Saprospiraceae bacterium]